MRWALALAAAGSVACGGGRPHPEGEVSPPHLGDAFYPWRAESLGITADAARQRDLALPDGAATPPYAELGEAMAHEAAGLYNTLCARCHGADGVPPDSVTERPRDWTGMGAGMGFFFGGDRMRAALYRRIRDGKPPAMPAWKSTLSREQIWALVQHLEGF